MKVTFLLQESINTSSIELPIVCCEKCGCLCSNFTFGSEATLKVIQSYRGKMGTGAIRVFQAEEYCTGKCSDY